MGITSIPSTIAASAAFPSGTRSLLKPFSFTATEIGSTPFTGLNVPRRESSPRTAVSASCCGLICPVDARIPTAIGRSNAAPSF